VRLELGVMAFVAIGAWMELWSLRPDVRRVGRALGGVRGGVESPQVASPSLQLEAHNTQALHFKPFAEV
jgi:hypothetical protein